MPIMRSHCLPLQKTLLHFLAIIATSVSAAPANSIPYHRITPHLPPPTNNITAASFSPPLTVWPTLPWWTKLRNRNLDPPAFLDIFSIADHPATPQQTYILQELVLLPLAHRIHQGAGPADESEAISSGGVRAEFVPVEGRAPSREVAATAVAALAMTEAKFGARGLRGAVRVGEVRVAGLEVWVAGVVGEGG